jgi:hypothetical protein
LENGQIDHYYKWDVIRKQGGHLAKMNLDEKKYYKGYPNDYRYKDTKNHSFDDFEKIIELCYKNNIKLDIIIGPSHIRQWEALDLYLGYENWLQWKKDMVISLDKVSKNYKNSRYKIVDFATYNGFTTEKIPKNPKLQMKYYWESSHYNNDLGKIVIDKLQNSVKVKEEKFGIEINLLNIDK